jgi:hypothetical protein
MTYDREGKRKILYYPLVRRKEKENPSLLLKIDQ